MSQATVSRTIKFLSKGGTYTAIINSPSGDVWQDYDGKAGAYTYTPDFTQTKPTLYLVVTSSRVAEGQNGLVTPTAVKYYLNGTAISFGTDNISTGTHAGYFKKVFPSDGQPYYGLQILKNIGELVGLTSASIKMEATVEYGSSSDTIAASYTVKIQKSTGQSYWVTIAAGDNNNFVIRTNDGSCILKAITYKGGTEVTPDKYTWSKMTALGWMLIEGQTGATLTVKAADVSTTGEYMVMAYFGDKYYTDVQVVTDASDPYDIAPHPVPEDETIEETGSRDKVVYTPVLVKRASGAAVSPNPKYFFVVTAASGTVLSKNTAAAASFTVTRAMCAQEGGDVNLTIMTETE